MKTIKFVLAAVAAGLAMLAQAGELLSTDFTSVSSLPDGWTATHASRDDVSYDSTKGAYVTNWNKNTLYTGLTTHPKMKTAIHVETYANNNANINAVIALSSDSYSLMIGNSYNDHPKIQIGSFAESVNDTYVSFKSADGKAPSNPTEIATSTEITVSKSLTYDLELFGMSLTGTVTDGTNTKEISYTLPAATSFTHIGFSLDGANGTVGIKKVTVSETAPHTFKVGLQGDEAGKFWLDGKEFLIRCGEMHYGRIPKGYWRDRIRKTKAMGFNAVCAYMFWNNHEPVPGHFRFDGEQDVREFCEIAQEEGMWVVLRPGPYTCAEWEFGGYPWWLLSSKMSEDGQINIRTKDADYRYYTDRYMQKVGEQLADMQITRGGNIIMIQVENEYGTYGNDAEYMKMEYDAIVKAGFDGIQKFTCNPTFNNGVTNARIPELFYVVNGSGGFFEGENRMQKLIDARLPGWENAPQMIGEYYTAWYDSWGGTHQTKAASAIVNDFKTFIERGVSFSVYMVYGGTSFGYWGGFNTPFVPMTTSYDYDSPINETGKLTDKFDAIKALFDQHMNEGETAVPAKDVPSWVGVQTGTIDATPTYASLWDAPSYSTVISEATDAPLTFENADLGYGYAIYETTLAAGQGGKLMADCRDLGVVRVDGEFVGYLDRRTTWGWVEIPTADHERKLEILVEALGRNHYAAFNDASKGLRGKPTLDKQPLSGWTMKTFNFLKWDDEKGEYTSEMDNLNFAADETPSARSGSFYKYNVTLDPTKDALLDMRAWRRGMVCVNGTWVGRYWTIGPQQTLYIPGCWLKAGENANEIIILDTVGVAPQNELTFAETHIISENRSDLDYYTAPELEEQPKSLEALWGDAVKTGNLEWNRNLQTVNFDETVTGRYFAFKATSAHSGQYASCAEFNLLDAAGQTIDRANWKVVSCSSQEQRGEDAQIEKMLDGNNSTIWHSEWKVVSTTLPQYFVIDLGAETTVGGFTWLGRQSGDAGFVNAYSVFMMNENPAIDPETGVTISSGTLDAPFTISSASDLNNVKVTLKSGAVMKVLSSSNCKLTISGEGKDSILILDGSADYGLNAGSKLENLTVVIDTERNIWLETRDPAVYDETTHLVVKSGTTTISGGAPGLTFGTVTLEGGTLTFKNSTTITVTDTLYLKEGATKPSGVTLAEGAKVEYIVEKVDLVWDNTNTDWTDSTKVYRGTELVDITADDTVVFKNFTGVLYDKRTNKTALKLEVREGDLKIGHDGYLSNGNGPKNLPDGSVVDIAEGSKVILRAWNSDTQSEKTINLAGNVTFNGPGSVEIASYVTDSIIGSISGTATLNLGTGTVTLREGAEITSPLAASTATVAGTGTIPYFSGMQFATTWTGTVKAGAVNNGGASLNVNRYGIEGSKVELDSLSNFWFPNDGRTVNPTLVLKGEMLVDDMSQAAYTLKHVTSNERGSLVLGTKKNISPSSFTIAKMSDFAGSLKNTTATTLTIATLVTSLEVIPMTETKVVDIIDSDADKFAVLNVQLADGTDITSDAVITVKADGIYVAPYVAEVEGAKYATLAEAKAVCGGKTLKIIANMIGFNNIGTNSALHGTPSEIEIAAGVTVEGYFPKNTSAGNLTINGTFKVTDGFSGGATTIPVLKGSGTIVDAITTSAHPTVEVTDWKKWTGSVDTANGKLTVNFKPIPAPEPEEGTLDFPEETIITKADGTQVEGTTIPDETGVYTVKASENGETETYGVLAAKAAETIPDGATSAKPVTTAVAVPFENTTVATLLNTSLLANDDTLTAYVDGKYRLWKLTGGQWVGQPMYDAEGSHDGLDDTTALARGTGVWVTTAGKIVTFGKYTEPSAVTPGEGTSLLGNINLDSDDVSNLVDNTDDGDQIIDPSVVAVPSVKVDGAWKHSKVEMVNGIPVSTKVNGAKVKVGHGFFYVRPKAK